MNEFQKRIGVGQPHYGLGRTGPTRKKVIIAEEGERKGKVSAVQTEHSSGRVDARVFVDTIHRKVSLKELA